MSLSRQQMIGAVGAGIFVVCAGGLGWMLYSAWSDKGEVEERVTEETDAFRRFNESAIYPSKASIDSVKSNETSYTQWYDSAVTLAARGDRAMQIESASKFKQLLEREVRRVRELPGGAGGKISAPTFLFGFEQYLGEGGVLPKEADVPRLAVQLESICRLADAFAEAGVYEVKSVTRLEEKSDKSEREDSGSSSSAKNKKQAANKEAEDAPKMTKESYAFEILARPTAIVQVLNKLTACERFVVVRNLSFRQSVDSIVDHIAAAKKAEDAKNAPSTGSRRRRGAAAAPADANPEALALASRIVADPEGDEPLTVSFTLDVYDFGRPAQASAAQEAKDADAAPADAGKADSAKPSAADAKAEEKKPAEKKAEKGDFE